jgi:hypothetical protein
MGGADHRGLRGITRALKLEIAANASIDAAHHKCQLNSQGHDSLLPTPKPIRSSVEDTASKLNWRIAQL